MATFLSINFILLIARLIIRLAIKIKVLKTKQNIIDLQKPIILANAPKKEKFLILYLVFGLISKAIKKTLSHMTFLLAHNSILQFLSIF